MVYAMLGLNMHIGFTVITFLSWPDNLYLPAFGQHAMDQALQSHRHAVDLWRPCFSNKYHVMIELGIKLWSYMRMECIHDAILDLKYETSVMLQLRIQ